MLEHGMEGARLAAEPIAKDFQLGILLYSLILSESFLAIRQLRDGL